MRTTTVPAQITTVEDRIAGSLTFTQIVLLIVPLFIGTAIYILIPVKMHIGIVKGIIIGLQFMIFGGLAIRFRGRILADWLVIYLKFRMRPRQYVFTKRDLTARDILDEATKKEKVIKKAVGKLNKARHTLTFSEHLKINKFFENPKLSVSLKLAKKGGLDVSLKTVKR
jgi:hypothetical protein